MGDILSHTTDMPGIIHIQKFIQNILDFNFMNQM